MEKGFRLFAETRLFPFDVFGIDFAVDVHPSFGHHPAKVFDELLIALDEGNEIGIIAGEGLGVEFREDGDVSI